MQQDCRKIKWRSWFRECLRMLNLHCDHNPQHTCASLGDMICCNLMLNMLVLASSKSTKAKLRY